MVALYIPSFLPGRLGRYPTIGGRPLETRPTVEQPHEPEAGRIDIFSNVLPAGGPPHEDGPPLGCSACLASTTSERLRNDSPPSHSSVTELLLRRWRSIDACHGQSPQSSIRALLRALLPGHRMVSEWGCYQTFGAPGDCSPSAMTPGALSHLDDLPYSSSELRGLLPIRYVQSQYLYALCRLGQPRLEGLLVTQHRPQHRRQLARHRHLRLLATCPFGSHA